MVYEATMRLMNILADHGKQLDADEKAEDEYKSIDWTDRGL